PIVVFSDEAGSYKGRTKTISLQAPPGYSIFYTLDGSTPSRKSIPYTKPIVLGKKGNRWVDSQVAERMTLTHEGKQIYPIKQSSSVPGANIIRAIAVAPDGTYSEVVTKTFFIGANLEEDFRDAMVISIVTDLGNLLDNERGILVKGKVYDEWLGNETADSIMNNKLWWKVKTNYTMKGKAWERPASIEFFDASNRLTLSQDCGIRVKGRISRASAQKSFNIFFKNNGADTVVSYPFLPNALKADSGEMIKEYEAISLRNGGNDADYLKFKDAWLQSRVYDKVYSTQKSRLAVLFLNGEYWGHYNLIEKYDQKYIENHYGVKNCLIISEKKVDKGSRYDYHLYEELMSFKDKDLTEEAIWEEFKQVMDIRNMAEYFATEIYIGNYDWSEIANTTLWRSTIPDPSNPYADGRWHFMLSDVEYSSGLYNQYGTYFTFDTFAHALKGHPLFASVIRNPEFQDLFLSAIRDVASRNFSPDDVVIDLKAWAKRWKPFMRHYYRRFKKVPGHWHNDIRSISTFFKKRSGFLMPAIEKELERITQDKANTAAVSP
ncbi:MAG: CotH kinase family protein, partial [Bacteroidales bacterium]|nr:CotH kinase family protein [Bacteroidales bacterium]